VLAGSGLDDGSRRVVVRWIGEADRMCRGEEQRPGRSLKGCFLFWRRLMTESTTNAGARRMLNERQVLDIVPLGRSTLLRMEKAGRFPKSTLHFAEPPDLVRR
jgi:hypothetical protein